MASIKITIVVSADPDENVHINTQVNSAEDFEVLPMLDKAIRALETEVEAFENCPWHQRKNCI